MGLIERAEQLGKLLGEWKDINRMSLSPIDVLSRISDLLEEELTLYAATDPDPFDDRQADVSDPNCIIAHLMKTLHQDEEFLSKVLTSYMFNSENNFELNCAASRLLLNLLPGLNEADMVQDVEMQVGKLLSWAKNEKEPLRTYACGLLSKVMLLSDCPGIFKEKNAELVPILIKRLKALAEVQDQNALCIDDVTQIDKSLKVVKTLKRKSERSKLDNDQPTPIIKTPTSARKRRLHFKNKSTEYRDIKICLQPLTVCSQQKITLHYLHVMGEYQELLPVAFELNVIDLIFYYINIKTQQDSALACNALFYLSSLLCHKKFVLEFVYRGGIQRILEIPQPSNVATMSSLCLYYIAHNEDAVERICLLSQSTVYRLVEYLLWLLECAHVSGRCHAVLFFSLTFPFRTILNLFDSMDGLRKVFNMISTLEIMRIEESELSTDESVFLQREMVKNACLTLKKYFTAHVSIIYHNLKRSLARVNNSSPPPPTPAYKSMFAPSEDVQDYIDFIHEYGSDDGGNECEKRAVLLNITPLLVQLVALASSWKNYSNRIDVIVTALESLVAMSFSRRITLSFCQQIEVSSTESQSGIKILLRAVEGELVPDVTVQKAALRVLCNCVWKSQKDGSKPNNASNQVLQKIWSSVRLNNGIKILMSALNTKVPITEADAIRTLACKALCALSVNEHICQVLSKLPMFHNENFHILMREPVLSDHIREHTKFQKYASILIERVTGKSFQMQQSSAIPMFTAINKADIIMQTKITYPQKELLSIIHDHLRSQGLNQTADMLMSEAKLPQEIELKPPATHWIAANSKTPLFKNCSPSLLVKEPFTPLQCKKLSVASPLTDQKSLTPLRRPSHNTVCTPASMKSNNDKLMQDNQIHDVNQLTLDSIVTGYLREQHAQCANPIATCPPFSLLRSHHCPEPQYSSHASGNITKRLYARQTRPRHGGIYGSKHNRRYLYSKFRSSGCIKDTEEDCLFTCCAWLNNEGICLGTQTGDVKIMSSSYGQEDVLHSCHGAPISTCYVSRNGKLMTTSAPFGAPLGAVWGINYNDGQPVSVELKLELAEDSLLQFSHSEERVVGTDDATAHVYDLTSGQLIRTFYDQRNASFYTKNFACFGPGDDLLLNDGCLWDVRSKKFIHKFDKFNDFVSGVFNPSGLEIIINSEVWDIRTFHLHHTCPALDMCRIVFSNFGDIIYGVKHSTKKEMLVDQSGMLGPYESTFRTFDSYDYSAVGTVDVRKTIYDISPNPIDQVLAVIETGSSISSVDVDTTCRFYDIGKLKGSDDSDEEPDDSDSDGHEDPRDDVMNQLFDNIFGEEFDDGEDGDESYETESENDDVIFDDDESTLDEDDDEEDEENSEFAN
ncbi:DDB1- and CUL4-associated factor 1 isoform X2 [Hydra vulgaris]|uniref:DDB1- and CUL4-associated factor 1 isoform X2 n=2 Tax=Hydra vulgaris TaxID=6087 RepID=UPI001F5FCFE6|nr:DDB1- and CUL4-associated factor 1-like isoform X2 [Hydra vulgaris]